MVNIWGFLVQTLEVSLVAVVILGLKLLFRDKLSARWQYGIWSVLLVGLVRPRGCTGRFVWRTPQVALQAVKTITESSLASRFTRAEKVVYNTSFVPHITGSPASITDIAFVIYVAGAAVCIMRYMVSYFRLSALVAAAGTDRELQRLTDKTAAEYSLRPTRVKTVPGLPSAFVFGIFRPVLVLPADRQTDSKVILHELLHLKYGDLWQKVMWSFFRALHWPNIFLQFIFNFINNDMETLCDYRVMEKLAGEERRDYGRILLSMTNEKYPSAFGTTSISNGSVFISERIKAIARFRKYPQGMGTVAVCMTVILLPAVMYGSGTADELRHPNTAKAGFDYQMQLEQYKMARCETVAGAIDTYAKAIFEDHPRFMSAVTPRDMHLQQYALPDIEDIYYFDTHPVLYFTVGLEKISDTEYSAGIMFRHFDRDNSDGEYGTYSYIIPVRIIKQNGWKVYQSADYSLYYEPECIDSTYGPPRAEDYSGLAEFDIMTEYGRLTVLADNISWFSDTQNNMHAKPNTDFTAGKNIIRAHFYPNEKCAEYKNIMFGAGTLASVDNSYDTSGFTQKYMGMQETVMSTNGPEGYYSLDVTHTDNVLLREGGFVYAYIIYDTEDYTLPAALQVDLWLNDWRMGDKTLSFKINLRDGEIIEN